MAINANHPFEELNGIRCAVVEKNCSKERVAFLKYILEGNEFEVVVVPSPPPKAAPAPAPKPAAAPTPPVEAAGDAPIAAGAATPAATTPAPAGSTEGPSTEASAPKPVASTQPPAEAAPPPPPPAPETFTVGVTDVTFNVTNAIYGRLLRSPDGRVVTMAYWQQKEDVSRDDIPYYTR
jgi:hypothetical protein